MTQYRSCRLRQDHRTPTPDDGSGYSSLSSYLLPKSDPEARQDFRQMGYGSPKPASVCTVMDRKHQDKVVRLPPEGDTRATFHPLVFTTGGQSATRHGTP